MLNNVLGWPIENRAIAMQAVGLSKCLCIMYGKNIEKS